MINISAGASSATIQSAIDQVSAVGGGTVNLASGGYSLSSALTPRSNVILNGAGTPATTINCPGDFVFHSAGGLSNLTFQNMKVSGSTTGGYSGINITTTGTFYTNIKVQNVQIMNFNGTGILLKRVNGMNVSNNNVHNNGFATLAHNMYLRNATSVTVAGNMSINGGGCGLHWAGTGSSGLSITGNTFTGSANAPGANIQDTPDQITFKSNNCSNNNNNGLSFTGTNALVDSNTCNNNSAVGLYTYSGSGTVSNNHASGNTGGSYSIHGSFTTSNNL